MHSYTNIHAFRHTSIRTFIHTCIHIHIYVRKHTFTFIYTHTRTHLYIHMHVHTHTHTYRHTYTCKYQKPDAQACVYIYICIRTHAHTYHRASAPRPPPHLTPWYPAPLPALPVVSVPVVLLGWSLWCSLFVEVGGNTGPIQVLCLRQHATKQKPPSWLTRRMLCML